LGEAYGLGLRATFFQDTFQMELGATYYEQFHSEFVINRIGSEVEIFDGATEVIPVEIGVRYNLGASRFYLSAGGTVYVVNSNVDDLDDEWGLYYRAGLQFPNLFVEVELRNIEGSVGFKLDLPVWRSIVLLGLDDDDHGLPVTDSRLGLSGVVVNVGWRF
jgi:hypothetical protein